jgi:cytidylate kinase
MPIPLTIAIDGPAASGKSTLGCLLARKLNYVYLDTGVMYRAVTWLCLNAGVSINDECAVTAIANEAVIDVRPPSKRDGRAYDVLANGRDITWEIREPEVDAGVSPVSAYAGVREAMTAQQKRIGERGKVVMVGRDIGTVVLPHADLKIYLDASLEERAQRRYAEITGRSEPANLEEILNNLRRRDEIDSTRVVAPLKAASDAVCINTDGMGIKQVLKRVLDLMR